MRLFARAGSRRFASATSRPRPKTREWCALAPKRWLAAKGRRVARWAETPPASAPSVRAGEAARVRAHVSRALTSHTCCVFALARSRPATPQRDERLKRKKEQLKDELASSAAEAAPAAASIPAAKPPKGAKRSKGAAQPSSNKLSFDEDE